MVRGNLIGTNAAGTAALPNGAYGVIINGAASSNVVGGTTAAERNVLSGNGLSGIAISGSGTTGNIVQGNYIGTNAAGTAALGNAGHGVFVFFQATSNTIGGSVTGAGNVISGNGQIGVTINDAGTSNNTVAGNLIGTDASGLAALPNATGVVLSNASNNTIGGTTTGAGNTIANNGVGVSVTNSGTGNGILGNSIFSNTGLGIDIGGGGLTANDPGDADTGPNNFQNFPVLTAAAGGVTGTLNSTASTTFRVELFSNTACDSSGNGEGALFLGSVSVTTDGSGNGSFPLFTRRAEASSQRRRPMPANNTSEFSACVAGRVRAAPRGHGSPIPAATGRTRPTGAAASCRKTATTS